MKLLTWKTVHIANLSALDRFAHQITCLLRPGCIILLAGAVGSGKTTFAQLLLKRLGVTTLVVSPTFTILKQYHGCWQQQLVTINHFDFYRLHQHVTTADWAMLTSYFTDNINVVEWPVTTINYQVYCDLLVEIKFEIQHDSRRVLKWRLKNGNH